MLYDEASNIIGHKTGVAKRIQDLQPKAYPTHCHGHSLSLSVKDTTKNCMLLSDTMDRAIVSLIKFSPKQENLLGEIRENLEGPESEAKGILGLCPTRWTVRASCFQRIPARQLCSSSSRLDNFPWWETPVRYTWKDHWMPSANEHFWLLLRVEFRTCTAAVFSHR